MGGVVFVRKEADEWKGHGLMKGNTAGDYHNGEKKSRSGEASVDFRRKRLVGDIHSAGASATSTRKKRTGSDWSTGTETVPSVPSRVATGSASHFSDRFAVE